MKVHPSKAKRGRAVAVAWLVSVAALAGCKSHPGPEQWDAHVQRFLDDYFAANPTFAVYQGKHELDGKLPDWSAAGVQAEIARLHRERDRASAFDVSRLDERRRFQRTYLVAAIDRDLFWLEDCTPGENQDHLNVYGRAGQPCPRCGTKVQRIRYADNETDYCPRCQTGGKLLADRALSRLLKKDWPRTVEELEALTRE